MAREKIAIVTDSTCDLPQELIQKYNIFVVPLYVRFGEEVYKEGVDITLDEFYSKLKSSNIHPSTSQPSPQDFMQVYQKLNKDYNSIISIHISSRLSGTVQSAKMAKYELKLDKIEVIDSLQVSLPLGTVVLEAGKLCEQEKSKEEIIKSISDLIHKVKIIFTVDTLEFLEKGGRIGKAQAFLGSILDIKPILGIQEGEVVPLAKVRGRKKMLAKLIEIIKEDIPSKKINIGIVHANSEETGLKLRELMYEHFQIEECIFSQIGAVIGTHTGPGTLGVGYYTI
ncbi:MAG: DegV family protein [bacterium]